MMKSFFILCTAVLLLAFGSSAQVLINELSNTNKVFPANEDDESDDWIELYNKGAQPVNLNAYSLTDNEKDLFKWVFPEVTINPGQYLMVYASGNNLKSAMKSSVIHWETAVHSGDEWRYFVGSSEPPSGWNLSAFNERQWKKGRGGFGNVENDTCIKTIVPSNATSVFARKTFFVPDTGTIKEAVLYMDIADGFVAYLNGVEIARKNMKSGKASYSSPALELNGMLLSRGEMPQSWEISGEKLKAALKPGDNVFAVQAHKSKSSGSLAFSTYLSLGISVNESYYRPNPSWMKQKQTALHTNFKLSAGEDLILCNAQGIIIDSYLVPVLELGHSMGRKIDGGEPVGIFTNPTPNASNNGQAIYSGYELPPTFSLEAGFYDAAQSLIITPQAQDNIVRFTTNGDNPTSGHSAYSGPINVGKTMVVTARAFGAGDKLPSQPVRKTFFIDEPTSLAVISISTDSLNLWDHNTGIYVKGPNASSIYPYFGANFWNNWEKGAYVEFFSSDRQLKAAMNTGLRIHGGYSRGFEQKSFRFYFRGNYGASSLDFPVFEERGELSSYKRLIIRNTGQDFYKARLRDGLFQRLASKLNLDYMAMEPAVVFINGRYWGHYNIRERTDKHYLSAHHKVNPEAIDLLEHKGYIQVKEGSDTGFYNIHNYITAADPANPGFYETVNAGIDLENFADFFIVQTLISNYDWMGEQTGNMRFWREQGGNGRWRYFLIDVDFGMGLKNGTFPSDNKLKMVRNPPSPNHHSRMFDKLLQNTQFRNYFINRYADIMNTSYHIDNLKAVALKMKSNIEAEMPRHVARWDYGISAWHQSINELIDFAGQRMPIARQQIQDEFNLVKQVNLYLEVQPPGAGKIQVNTIIPDSLPWTGIYFDGVPVTLTALGESGYEFGYWAPNGLLSQQSNEPQLNLNLGSEETFTAHFIWTGTEDEENSPFKITLSPNPASNNMLVEIAMRDRTNVDYTVTVIDQNGKPLQQWEFLGNQQLTLQCENFSPGLYYLRISSENSSLTRKIIFN